MESIFQDSNTIITPELNDFYSNSFLVKGDAANDNVIAPPQVGTGDDSKVRALINKYNNISDLSSSSISNVQSTYTDPFADAKIFAFNPTYKGLNWDRYKNHFSYDELGFDPFRDNDKFYNNNTSIFSDFTRAAQGFLNITGNAFVNTAADLPKMLTGDFSPSVEAARDTERIMAETMSTRGTLGSSVLNFGINAGFTVGIIGELLVEEMILAAVGLGGAAETGGASLGAAGYLAAVRAGMAGSKIIGLGKTLGALGKTMRHLDDASAAKNYFLQFGRGAAEFLNPLQSTTSLIKNYKNFNGLGQVARASQSFGAFFKDVRNINRSLSEAKLEGGFVQNTMFEKLMGEAYADGKTPSVDDIDAIKEQSLHAGYVNEMINFPVILYTNNIVFNNLTKPLNRLIGSTEDSFKLLGKTISGDITRKQVFKVMGSGWAETLKVGLNPRLMAKNSLNYFSANLAEGLQESFQEASSIAVEDYYTKQFYNERSIVKNQYELSMLDSYGKGLNAQFSGQGFETFLSGFLMGGLMNKSVQGIKSGISTLNESSNKVKDFFYSRTNPEAFKTAKENREEVKLQKEAKAKEYDTIRNSIVTNLNEFYADAGNMLSPDLANMSAQEILSAKINQASENGDSKFLIDFTDESLYKNVTTALYTNKFDLFIEHLEKISSLDNEDISQALGVEDAEAGRQRLLVSIERAKNIKQRSEKYAENPFKINDYKKGSDEYNEMQYMHNAYEDAKNSAIFQPYQFDRVLSRMSSITKDFTSIDLVANGNATEFLHLFGLENIINEVEILDTEIQSLKDGTKENEALAKRKKNQIKDLSELQKTIIAHKEYYKAIKEDDEVDPSYDKNLKNAFIKYLGTYGENKSRLLKSDKFDNAFKLFLDYYRLNIDAEYLSRSVAVVADPDFLRRDSLRRYNAIKKMHTNRKDLIEKSVNAYIKKIGLNGVFQKLYDAGYVGEPKEMIAYNISGGKIPIRTFYRVNDLSQINATDTVDLAKINEIFKEYEDVTGVSKEKEEDAIKAAAAAAKKVEEEVAAAKLLEKEKALDIYTPETKAKLVADYENYPKKTTESFEEYLESPIAARIIAAEKQPGITPVAPIPSQVTVFQDLKNKIEKFRTEEEVKYAAIDPNDTVARKKIYDDYDKLITPLLRDAKADIEKRKLEELQLAKVNTNISDLDRERLINNINREAKAELESLNKKPTKTKEQPEIVFEEQEELIQPIKEEPIVVEEEPIIVEEVEDEVVTEEEVKPEFPISPMFKGKIIYFSPGLGKTTLVSQYPDQFVDMDVLLYEEFKEEPGFENATPETIGEVVFAMYKINPEFRVIKDARYASAFKKAQALAKQGKTVLTGSIAFIGSADYKIKASNEDISKEAILKKNPNITDIALKKYLKKLKLREDQNNIVLSIDKDSFIQFLMGNVNLLEFVDKVVTRNQLYEIGKYITSSSPKEVIEAFNKKMEYLNARHLLFTNLQPGDTVIIYNENTEKNYTTKIMKFRNENSWDLEYIDSKNSTFLNRDNLHNLINVISFQGASEGIQVDELDNSNAENNKEKVNDIATETERLKALLNEKFDDDNLFDDSQDPNNCKTN